MHAAGWIASALITLAGLATVAVFAVLHFEGLSALNRLCFGNASGSRRKGVVAAVLGVTLLHLVQIVGWGAVLWLVVQSPAAGAIDAGRAVGLLEAVYVSGLNYSTLGLGGDLQPVGPVRVLVAMESLVGLLMITWSASFTYHHLAQHLDDDGRCDRAG